MPKKFLLLTKCGGGVPADKCIESCIKNKAVYEVDGRLRIKRNIFNEIEQFVGNLEVTSLIKRVLDDICPDTVAGCQHVYK